jgi:ABC-type bacteriocin/lantibiotic exporter with double-glycine peptidase domain
MCVDEIYSIFHMLECAAMTREQVIWNFAIGVILIVFGAAMRPVFKQIWKFLNRPSPLTPQTKGKLMEELTNQQNELNRVNKVTQSSQNLFLHLFQLLVIGLILFFISLVLFVFKNYYPLMWLASFLFFAFSIGLLSAAVKDSFKLSDTAIQGTRQKIAKRISEIKALLDIPE